MRTIKNYLQKLKKLLKSLRSPALYMLWRMSEGQRSGVFLLSVLYILSAFLGLAFPLLVRELVDGAVAGDRTRLMNSSLLLGATTVAQLTVGYLRSVLSVKVRARMVRHMRADAVSRLVRKQYAGLQRYHSGELVNRVFSDVNVAADGILGTIPPLLFLVIQLVGASVILFRMNSGFLVVLLTAGVLGAVFSMVFKSRMKVLHKDAQRAEDKLHARIQEILGNLRIIKASGVEQKMVEETESYQEVYEQGQLRRGRFSAKMNTGLGLLFRGSWLYAMIWGCMGIFSGTMTYGTLTAVLQLVGQIQGPFEGMISTLGTAYGAISSTERLMELYGLPNDQPKERRTIAPGDFRSITMEGVSFRYDRGEVIRDLDLTIRAGDTMAVMGPSGCGKSTLFQLLLGVYQPGTGRITVRLGQETLQGGVNGLYTYVPQGNALFSGSIRENISLFCAGKPTDEEIWQAAQLACIDDFIREQAQGLDTVIGEHGLGLSEGQAQRVAIARGLMMKNAVLLLDESTSALDEATEARVLANIAAMKDRTCLIVTHRRAALAICNRCVRIRDGQAVEEAAKQ